MKVKGIEYFFGVILDYDKNLFKLLKVNLKVCWWYLFCDIIYFKYVISVIRLIMCWCCLI